MKRPALINNKTINIDILGVLFLLFFCVYYGHADIIVHIRNFALNIKHVLFIALIVFAFLFIVADLIKGRLNFKQYSFFLWYAVFYLYCCISLLWTINYDISAEMLTSMLNHVAALFIVVYYVNSEAKFFRIIKIQLFAFCYMALRLIIFLPEKHLFGRGRNKFYINEITGEHYNGLAILLTVGIIIAAFIFLKTKKRLVLVLIPIFYYVIFIGGSRQGVIIPVAGLFAMYAMAKGIKQIYKSIIVLALIIAGFIVYINSDFPGANSLLSLVNGFINETGEGSFNERALFRKWAMSMFTQRPVFGWGINSFKAYLKNINYYNLYNHCHNTYLELLSGLGVIGFTIYFSMPFRILIRAFKHLAAKNAYVVFSLAVCFTLLLFGYGESLIAGSGLTSAMVIFYAYYALKIHSGNLKTIKKEENTGDNNA